MSSLTCTLIQTNLYWEDKQANLASIEDKIFSLKEKTEIIVLPEMFSTGFGMNPEGHAETMDGNTVTWMKRIAAQKRVIITGSIIIKENGHYFNRLLWMLPTGEYGVYDKRHLFSYAGEDRHFTAGSRRLIVSVKGWKINLQVCYDLRFPVWARQDPFAKGNDHSGPEYDVLIYVANWPERRIHPWQILLQARAIENQCYVIGVNRVGNDGHNIYHSGESTVVNALGEVIYQKAHEEDVVTITLEKNHLQEVRTKFPFLRDADYFKIIDE